jgi:hypothetical protein
MKKICFITLAALVAIVPMALAATHTVGGGGGGGNTIPFWGSGQTYYPQMRFQTMWRWSELAETGSVTQIEWQAYPGYVQNGGTFNGCLILLCNSNVATIGTTYTANYGTGTPVTVYSGNYVKATPAGGSWSTIVSPTNFSLTNNSNLLIEVSWTSYTGGGYNYMTNTSSGGPGRVYAASATASTGTLGAGYWQVGRITITPGGVAPSSLGHVKALYK